MTRHSSQLWDPDEFFNHIKREFQFLIDDFGYSVVSENTFDHSDLCEIRFETSDTWILIARVRGGIAIFVGKMATPDFGFTWQKIVRYIKNDMYKLSIRLNPGIDQNLEYSKKLKKYIKWYSKKLMEYYDQIHKFLVEEEFADDYEAFYAMKKKEINDLYDRE